MLIDSHKRKIDYLRISVTDKCNLRCIYCMPSTGIKLKNHEDILSLEKIYEIAKTAVDLGIEKIRLTGGEPLIRRNILFLIKEISALPGLKDFSLTTNGVLLPKYAYELKAAGLKRINISLDSLDEKKYCHITRGGYLQKVLEGIFSAKDAGFDPIKINVVLIPGFNEEEKSNFLKFSEKYNLDIRFIPKMDLKVGVRQKIEGNTNVGQCIYCNRLRLTCDGYLKPCLFSDYKISIKKYGIKHAFNLAVGNKPESGKKNNKEHMYEIGG